MNIEVLNYLVKELVGEFWELSDQGVRRIGYIEAKEATIYQRLKGFQVICEIMKNH